MGLSVISLYVVLSAALAEPASGCVAEPFFVQSTIAAHSDSLHHGLPCLARLNNERLLAVWSQYAPGSNDFGVVGAFSVDGGCTWSQPRVLIDHPGLLDADPGIVVNGDRVLVTCTSADFSQGIRTSATWCVRSEDNGKAWSEPYEIPMNHRYTCGKCHHGVRLQSGVLLFGYSWDVLCEQGQALPTEGAMDLRAGVMRSEDGGLTWTNGGDTTATYEKVIDGAVLGTDEPAIVALEDGSVYMLMRTGGAHLYEARSRDEGKTWQDIQPSPLPGTNAPAALCRFEDNGRSGILAVWDNARDRFPLCAAASLDGGKTWSAPRDIGAPYTGGQASYPSCEQAPDGALVAVWQQDLPGGRDVRLARFNVAWLLDEAPTRKRLVLFGESTTAARGALRIFGNVLAEDFAKQGMPIEIINAGKGGENTDAARERFAEAVLAKQPAAVTLYYGLNDAAVDVWKDATAPRVTVERFKENMAFFVQQLKQQGALPILMTPNPCVWSAQERELYGKPPYDVSDPDGHNVFLAAYVAALRELAAAEQVPLVDVFQLFKDHAAACPSQRLFLDGVHPNELGHQLIAAAVKEQLLLNKW